MLNIIQTKRFSFLVPIECIENVAFDSKCYTECSYFVCFEDCEYGLFKGKRCGCYVKFDLQEGCKDNQIPATKLGYAKLSLKDKNKNKLYCLLVYVQQHKPIAVCKKRKCKCPE